MATRPTFDIGDKVRLAVLFRVDGTLTNATTPQCAVLSPASTTTTYATSAATGVSAGVTASATGSYYVDIRPDKEGVWRYEWSSPTGTAEGIEAGSFEVRASRVT